MTHTMYLEQKEEKPGSPETYGIDMSGCDHQGLVTVAVSRSEANALWLCAARKGLSMYQYAYEAIHDAMERDLEESKAVEKGHLVPIGTYVLAHDIPLEVVWELIGQGDLEALHIQGTYYVDPRRLDLLLGLDREGIVIDPSVDVEEIPDNGDDTGDDLLALDEIFYPCLSTCQEEEDGDAA